jgi:glycosyltransferase involved in cell wall biosynthesis
VPARERLTVIVPCFNEERSVADAAEAIRAVSPELDVDVDVILVDDRSRDGTWAEIQRLARDHGWRAVRNDRNLGLGRSVMNAYAHVPAGSWVTVLPGDNELDFSSIRNFLAIRRDFDVILGYLQNPVIRSAPRRLASWAFTRAVEMLYGFDYRYLNGLKLYRVDVFRGIEVVSSGHAFNAELLAKAILRDPHLRIGEAPFVARGRALGESKAIRPPAIGRAIWEVAAGFRSVAAFRRRVVRGSEESGEER